MLLLHNQEDLSGLISLSDLCAYQSLLNGKFTVKSCRLRDDSAALTLRLEYPLPQNIQAAYPLRKKAAASRQNTSRKNLPASDSSSGSGPNDADWNPQTRFYVLNTDFSSASLEIPVFRGELLYFFPNYRDYYYLPLERQAIHRSVAAFVDRKHRTPAKPSNCCVRKTGVFLPQPSELVTPAFVPYYRSGERYFEYRENYENQPELLADYAKAVLKLFL